MRILLDTSVLIGGFSGLDDSWEISVSSITLAELRYGANRPGLDAGETARRGDRLITVEKIFGAGIPFDDSAARSFGLITAYVEQSGRSVRGRMMDLLIAATAHAHRAAVMTANLGDFGSLEPLVTIYTPEGQRLPSLAAPPA